MTKKPTTKAPDKPKGILPSDVRARRPKPLSNMVERLTKSMLGRQGFAHGAIISKWPEIVGLDMARHTQPEKIVFSRDGVSGGTLHLRCASGALATEVQHLEPQILERINTFFGYKAVVRVKLIQGPLPRAKLAPQTQPPRPLSPSEAKNLAATVANVDDDELREALERLGQSILGRKKD
jgi:hypothetical protein